MDKLQLLFVATFIGIAVLACKKDDKEPDEGTHEEVPETITTVKLLFSPLLPDSLNNDSLTFSWSDPDGANGNDPDITPIVLKTGMSYNVSIEFWDYSGEEGHVDLTPEIEEEKKAHIICYTVANGADLDIVRNDTDGTYKVGLETSWYAGKFSEGNVGVVLKHQPGGKDGTCDQGETDVQVSFPVFIEN